MGCTPMRRVPILVSGSVVACLALAAGVGVSAGTNGNDAKKRSRPAPGRPAGSAPAKEAQGPGYGVDPAMTIRAHRNPRGETVWAVAAAHFDISPPLRVMAAGPAAPPGAEEEEAPTNPMLPRWRIPRSIAPDPVVQSAVPPG